MTTVFIAKGGTKFDISSNAVHLVGSLAGDEELIGTTKEFNEVDSEVMTLIVKYLGKHDGRPPPDIQRPLRSSSFEKCIDSQWDISFISDVSISDLLKLIAACEETSMDIRPLYDLACARMASYVRGKTSQELKTFLDNNTQ